MLIGMLLVRRMLLLRREDLIVLRVLPRHPIPVGLRRARLWVLPGGPAPVRLRQEVHR